MKHAQTARILVVALLASLPLFGQRQSSSMPSFIAITPGSIRAAGSPTGPIPQRSESAPVVNSGRHHHPRGGGFVSYGFPIVPYGGYYYGEPEQPAEPPQPVAPVEPARPGATLFEHDGKPMEQPPVTPREPVPVVDEKPGPPTILVFRDGHQQEIQNYAILGDKLIILTDARAKRIGLEELDLDATVKANDEQGVEFRLPGKG